MEIKSPNWYLKKTLCPLCEGQGRLEFSSCPNCHYVVLICEEEGAVYTNLSSPEIENIYRNFFSEDAFCPNCKSVKVEDFINATSEQIQSLGFSVEEYE